MGEFRVSGIFAAAKMGHSVAVVRSDVSHPFGWISCGKIICKLVRKHDKFCPKL
jgi:hypothetical protein